MRKLALLLLPEDDASTDKTDSSYYTKASKKYNIQIYCLKVPIFFKTILIIRIISSGKIFAV